MAWRKWLVRGVVFSALGGICLGALVYQAWTNPTATKRQVLDKLGQKFTGAVVGVESARLWPFGYIDVSELRMSRRDDLDHKDFLYAPSVHIFHDKEQLLQGHLAISRVEMNRPLLRIVRYRDGKLNLNDILGPLNVEERVPLIVMHQATVTIEDQAGATPLPLVEIAGVNLTIINDPLPILNVEAAGKADVAGAIHVAASLHRDGLESSATIEASAIPVGPALLERLALLAPRVAGQLSNLTGTGKVKATLVKRGHEAAISYDVNAELHGGTFAHAQLPLALEQIQATAHVQDGHVSEAHLAARSGEAALDLSLHDAILPGGGPACLEDLVKELDVRIEHLPITPTLLAGLPAEMQEIQTDYKPMGAMSLTYSLRHEGSDRWRKHTVFQPQGMSTEFFKFPYPVREVTGTIDCEATSDKQHAFTLNLAGIAGGRPIRVMGRLEGERPKEKVEIDVWVDNVPIDDVLLGALPTRSRAVAAKFELSGQTDVKAEIRREAGQREFANRYFLRFHDACARFDQFPYPLEKVSGVLDILPDHWECKDFRGAHKGGEIRVSGRSVPLSAEPGKTASERDGQDRPQRVQVTVEGNDVLLDNEFEAALGPPQLPGRAPLQRAWRMLVLDGRLSFKADVVDLPDQPQSIDVGVDVHGCSMKPKFFPYQLQEVSGTVHYARDEVRIGGAKARHGTSVLGLREGRIILKQGGGFQARLAGITGNPVVPSGDFLQALPTHLRRGLEPLNLADPVAIDTKLIVDVSPEPGSLPLVWWDGSATLHKASFRAGLELKDVDGEVACTGQHNGRCLDGVVGNIWLKQATILNQPISKLHGRIEVSPKSPEVFSVKDLGADCYGGTVIGEARVELKDVLRYELDLSAAQVRLEEFARNNPGANADVQGAATAKLYLKGEGPSITGLSGRGRVDVPDGKLYRLPFLLDLIKAFGLRVPDRTAFEQAAVTFKIDGPQLEIQQINLKGNAICLRGQGILNLDGSDINLDFHTDWAPVMQVLPPGFNPLPRAVGDRLFKIKMRGRVGDIRLEKEVVPVVTEPIRRALGRD